MSEWRATFIRMSMHLPISTVGWERLLCPYAGKCLTLQESTVSLLIVSLSTFLDRGFEARLYHLDASIAFSSCCPSIIQRKVKNAVGSVTLLGF